MTDYTDSWMNPGSGKTYTSTNMLTNPYVIERCRKLPVTGNVAFVRQWEVWSSHPTAAERDAELAELRARHPAWLLRAKTRQPLWARLRASL